MQRLEFYARFGMLLAIVGGVGSAMAIWAAMHGGTPTFGLAPLVCLVLGVMGVTRPLVVLEERWFMARPSALWGEREILYKEVQGLEMRGDELLVRLGAREGGDFAIRLKAFAVEERGRIAKELAARIERYVR